VRTRPTRGRKPETRTESRQAHELTHSIQLGPNQSQPIRQGLQENTKQPQSVEGLIPCSVVRRGGREGEGGSTKRARRRWLLTRVRHGLRRGGGDSLRRPRAPPSLSVSVCSSLGQGGVRWRTEKEIETARKEEALLLLPRLVRPKRLSRASSVAVWDPLGGRMDVMRAGTIMGL
jgi:hypothetical protein